MNLLEWRFSTATVAPAAWSVLKERNNRLAVVVSTLCVFHILERLDDDLLGLSIVAE